MTDLTFRDATLDDLDFIVPLIVEDSVIATEDQPDSPRHPAYVAAFDAIAADPNQRLIIAELDGVSVGTLQLTFVPGIARLGMSRGLVEAVHIAPSQRNRGFGAKMMAWAVEECRARN